MPPKAKVFLHYGPYESCGVVDHREARLEGMRTVLEKDHHQVHFVKINDWNTVELWVNGELIYTCDLRELDYGSDGQLDPLCDKALHAVQEAF